MKESDDVTPEEIDVVGDGGVIVKWKKRVEDGREPRHGDTLQVRYVGTIQKTGREFDRTHGGYSFEFQLGAAKVVRGFELGIAKLRIGEEAILTIRGDYGYGKEGSGNDIPKNAILIFQVELVGIKPCVDNKKDRGESDRERLASLREEREAAALALRQKKEAQAAKVDAAKNALAAKLASKNAKGKKKGKK
mmetsp:Transcript_3236/g.4482  ORF Transcript_3236/g.4482 Transcript_3236/m.4482 type:complete len:192 (+) Transcript_3236:87-662(+)